MKTHYLWKVGMVSTQIDSKKEKKHRKLVHFFKILLTRNHVIEIKISNFTKK